MFQINIFFLYLAFLSFYGFFLFILFLLLLLLFFLFFVLFSYPSLIFSFFRFLFLFFFFFLYFFNFFLSSSSFSFLSSSSSVRYELNYPGRRYSVTIPTYDTDREVGLYALSLSLSLSLSLFSFPFSPAPPLAAHTTMSYCWRGWRWAGMNRVTTSCHFFGCISVYMCVCVSVCLHLTPQKLCLSCSRVGW